MGKVFAQVTPAYNGKLAAVEADVNAKENYALTDKYKVMSIPTCIFIDSSGKVVDKVSGVYSPQQIAAKLNQLLKR